MNTESVKGLGTKDRTVATENSQRVIRIPDVSR